MTDRSEKVSLFRRARRVLLATAAVAAIAAAGAGSGLIAGTETNFLPAAKAAQAGPVPRLQENGFPMSFADLVESVSPAVVTVVVEREAQRQRLPGLDDVPAPFRDFFRQFGGQGQDGQGGGGGGGGNGGRQGQQGQQNRQGQQGQGQQGQGQQGQGQQGQNRNRGQQTFRAQAMGSGFIIDRSGYIVTNNHVVEEGRRIAVRLPSGKEYDAKVIGTDKETDVALLKVDNAPDLPTVAFGEDSRMRVGDWVVAVGNPFGLGGTVTAGIVSSIHRDIGNGPYTDYIQIDAPINQGNSGGPTFDLSGRVVGMNTAIYSPSGGSVGIGFMIPASTVKAMVDQLRDHGAVTRGWLGVQIQSMTPDMAASLGQSSEKGAIVAGVIDDSPAAKAGFNQGDVILSLNGSDIEDSRDLTRKVGGLVVGDRASFMVLRDGKRQNITAIIAKRDEVQLASSNQPAPNRGNQGQNRPAARQALGLDLMPLTDETRSQYNVDDNVTGVVVSNVDQNSEAAEKGFRQGDVIVSVGNKSVKTVADLEQGIADARQAGRENVLLLVAGRQGAGQRYVALKIARG